MSTEHIKYIVGDPMISMNEAQMNESYVVAEITGGEHWILRLKSLGIEVGSQIRVRHRLPFGGPIVLQVLGTTFALRKGEANCIKLQQKT